MKPDVVWRTLELAMECAVFDLDAARRVEKQVREEFGGERVRVPKEAYRQDRGHGRSPMPEELAKKVYHDALNEPKLSTAELGKRHGISRATIYRLMKRGPAG